MMRKFLFLMLILFCQLIYAAPTIIPVGSVGDSDCQFNTIQEAVDSGLINMDIRISNQLDTVNGVSIVDKDIAFIRGGYANCQNAIDGIVDVSAPHSTISNNNGDGLTINYSTFANHTINIQGLKVNQSQRGIDVVATAPNQNLTLNFETTQISTNTSSGLNVKGNSIIINFDNGEISQNIGAEFGGGVRCFLSEMNFGEHVAIHHNSAEIGGGLSLNACSIEFLAGDVNDINSLQYGIYSNSASLIGGGLYIIKSNVILSGTNQHPISIVNNSIPSGSGAMTRGGGIYISNDSLMLMGNIRLENNTTENFGAGIYAEFSNTSGINPTVMQVGRLLDGCSYSDICNSISFNQTNGFTTEGGAIYLKGGVSLTVGHTRIEGNSAGSAVDSSIFEVIGGSQLALFSNLIINNVDADDLIKQEDMSNVLLRFDTLADNQVNNYFNVLYDNNNAQLLEVKESIIMNGVATVANLNNDMGNHDAQVKCSLVETDDATGVVQNQSIIGVASFLGNNNYKLQKDSLGLNSTCTNIGEFDLVRYDILNVDRLSSITPDLGAYEMGYLFDDGFE